MLMLWYVMLFYYKDLIYFETATSFTDLIAIKAFDSVDCHLSSVSADVWTGD